MKNFLVAATISLLGTTVFFGYEYFRVRSLLTDIKETSAGDPAKPCKSKLCKEYFDDRATGRINGYLAHILARKYRGDKGKKYIWNRDEITGIQDARSAWFPLETIKRYIWEIENKNCGNKCADSLGIRIYYGKYPATADVDWAAFSPGVQTVYANHHTLFMTPTWWDVQNKRHVDFDPWIGCRKPIDTSHSVPGNAVLLIGAGGDAQNHGSLIPPDGAEGTDF